MKEYNWYYLNKQYNKWRESDDKIGKLLLYNI